MNVAEAVLEFPLAPARDVVARLTRAVQRATIYPDGRPATRVATAPLVDAVNAVLLHTQQFVVGVTSGSLYVGARIEEARPFDSPWLASRLAALDIAAIRFQAALSLESGEALVRWLARASDASASAPATPPLLGGCEISKIDFSAARFKDADGPPRCLVTHIADVFDALRTNRPYRAALSRDRIREMMERDAGTAFDPGLLNVFFESVVPRTSDAVVEPDDSEAA